MTTSRVEEARNALDKIREERKEQLAAGNADTLLFVKTMEGCLGLVEQAEALQPEQIPALQAEFERYDELHKNGQLPPALKERRASLYWLLQEFAHHEKYRELLQVATSSAAKQRQHERRAKAAKSFDVIERIFARSGAVHVQHQDGKVTTWPLKEACERTLLAQDQLKDPNVPEWHKKRIRKLVDESTRACIEARRQLADPENKGANLIREVFNGVDAEGRPLKVEITDQLMTELHNTYFTVSEDEIRRTLQQEMPKGLHTYSQRTALLQKLHEARCQQVSENPYPEVPNGMQMKRGVSLV